MRKLTISLILTAAIALSTTGCDEAIKASPVPARVAMAGDSIGLQAMYYGSSGLVESADCSLAVPIPGWDPCSKVGLGWKAEHAQPRVTSDVAGIRTSPETLIVEFGHNYGSGFSTANQNAVTSLVFSPDPSACVVGVLPYAPPTLNMTHRVAIQQYRTHLGNLAAVRPRTVLVDWKPIAEAHPEYIASDGVHLNVTETVSGLTAMAELNQGDVDAAVTSSDTAAVAFMKMMISGVAACSST